MHSPLPQPLPQEPRSEQNDAWQPAERPSLRLLEEPDAAPESGLAPVETLPDLLSPEPLPPLRTLIVEPEADVRQRFASILAAEGYEVQTADSLKMACELLAETSFDILLCAMTLPEQSGLEMLAHTNAEFPTMPVILIADSEMESLTTEALHQGASDVISPQCGAGELPMLVERNLTRQTIQRRRALRSKPVPTTTTESMLDALLSALSTHDTEPPGHLERVTAYTMELADKMGLSAAERYPIERGALLHDIGKIGIPDRILRKPGALTAQEWQEIKHHPRIGYEMCGRIEMLREAALIVLHHHEAWDGSGYPWGLKGEDIPLGARLFAVADTLDAITSEQPYRPALSYAVAREEIARHSGTQFDPEIVAIFLSIPEARWAQIRDLAGRVGEV